MRLRVSTTHIEAYRLACTEEWKDEASLIASIRGEPFPQTEAMRLGTAWHSLIEYALLTGDSAPDQAYLRRGDYSFRTGDLRRTLAYFPEHAMPEVKATRSPVVDGVLVDVVAKVDVLYGSTIFDVKTKLDSYSVAAYEASLQWRLYLWIFDASVFTYLICKFREKNGEADLVDVVPYRFYPYPQLGEDCRGWLTDFVRWAKERNLTKYLEREGTT